MASPDSSCRVAGDDVDVKMTTLDDDVDDDVNYDSAPITHADSPPAAATVMSGDALHRLSWLQCTRYKPPKLPRNYHLSIYDYYNHNG